MAIFVVNHKRRSRRQFHILCKFNRHIIFRFVGILYSTFQISVKLITNLCFTFNSICRFCALIASSLQINVVNNAIILGIPACLDNLICGRSLFIRIGSVLLSHITCHLALIVKISLVSHRTCDLTLIGQPAVIGNRDLYLPFFSIRRIRDRKVSSLSRRNGRRLLNVMSLQIQNDRCLCCSKINVPICDILEQFNRYRSVVHTGCILQSIIE